MKNECIARRAEYERLQQPYTAEMIISSKKILSAVSNDLKSVIQHYIDDKGLESRTIENGNGVLVHSHCCYSISRLMFIYSLIMSALPCSVSAIFLFVGCELFSLEQNIIWLSVSDISSISTLTRGIISQ